MLYIKIVLLIVLLIILYQDFRFQAVSWIFFLIGFVLTMWISVKVDYLPDIFLNVVINTLFVLFQLCIIYLFTWIKYKQRKNIFKSVFGFGDLLFLIMIIPLFSPLNFIVFFIASIIFSLLVYSIINWLRIYKKQRVPLAGLQSLFLLVVIISQIFIKFSLYNDYIILEHIIRKL